MRIIMIVAFVLLTTVFSTANAQHRIGHINSDNVMEAMPEYAQAKVDLDSLKASYQQVMDNMHAEYDNLEKEMEYHSDAVSDSVKNTELNKLQSLQDAIKDMETKAKDEMEKTQDEKMDAIQDEYLQAVSTVARAKGYAYIFDMASDAVVYVADKKDDITEAVYKKLGIIPPSMTTDTSSAIVPGMGR